jgi:hypothetical protein
MLYVVVMINVPQAVKHPEYIPADCIVSPSIKFVKSEIRGGVCADYNAGKKKYKVQTSPHVFIPFLLTLSCFNYYFFGLYEDFHLIIVTSLAFI